MPRERNDGPRFPDRCRSCGRPFPCRDCLSDRDADRWAAANAPGVAVPKENDRRLLGGNLDRTDRGDPQDQLRALDAKRRGALELRHYLDIIEARLEVIQRAGVALEGERKHHEIRRVVLALDLAGVDQREIATQVGFGGHSSVSELLTKIRAEATERYAQRVVVSTPCRCGRAGCVVTRHAGTGRPRAWNPKCREMAKWAKDGKVRLARSRRRRRGFGVSIGVSATGGQPTPAA